MLRRNNGGLFLAYIIVSIVTLLAQWQGLQTLVYIFKPLMLIVLSTWFFLNTRMYGDRFTLLIQAGLFFSLLGDVALMFTEQDEFFFLIGMAMFLIAQLCFFAGFTLNIANAHAPWKGMVLPTLISIGILAFAYWSTGVLMPRVDHDISTGVGFYLLTLCFMSIAAAFRWQRTFKRSWYLVLSGCLLFFAFDGLLAFDRFIDPQEHGELYILATYALAQVLIAMGCVWHVRSPTHVRKQEILNA